MNTRILVALFLACCISAGCALDRARFHAMPDSETPRRLHPLGMIIYNSSGEDISEKRWREIFAAVEKHTVVLKILPQILPIMPHMTRFAAIRSFYFLHGKFSHSGNLLTPLLPGIVFYPKFNFYPF